MAISDRINEMYTHVGDVYDTITNVDLPTNKNIQNIPSTMRSSYLEIMNNGIDKIWNNWEKVTGEGETITLNSTEEAPMKINLKGNTSQETTTGKNLQPPITTSTTMSGITFTPIFENKMLQYVNVNGTSTGVAYMDLSEFNFSAGTYTITGSPSGGSNSSYQQRFVTGNDSLGIDNGSGTSVTLNTATRCRIRIRIASGYTANNLKFYPMVRLSSITDATYEPYTNGASPNPQYPQDIHVVSGDNEINVCGKNLLENQYLPIPSANNTATYEVKNAYLSQGTYTLATTDNSTFGNTVYIKLFKKDKQVVKESGHLSTSNGNYSTATYNYFIGTANNLTYIQFTIDDDYYARIGLLNSDNTKEVMLVKGTEIVRTYEPYQGNTYNIDLPVENLFDKDNANYVNGWIDSTTMRLNTINGNRMFYIPCKPNTTYTISRSVITSSFRTTTYDSTPFPTVTGSNVDYTVPTVIQNNSGTTLTITTNANAKYLVVHYGKIEDTNLNEMLATIQVEYGSKANSYTPYGTTPIELCKIGGYQDSIKKSTGKNLFDKDNLIANYRLGSDGTPFYQSGYSLTEYISVEPNTTYCRNIAFATVEPVCLYDSGKTFISRITTGSSFTTTSETKYIRTAVSTDKINITQLEKGSSVSDYEPYGKIWYLNKQIGKVVFDGSESWAINTSYTYNVFYRTLDNYARISNTQTTYCEYYKGIENTAGIVDFGNNYNNSIGVRTANDNIKDIYISNNSITSASDFKTWLSTHNTVVYYVLATPTYTEITDSTLINQLETVKRSYNGQTNISQVNNDKPFILDVTALKELTQ